MTGALPEYLAADPLYKLAGKILFIASLGAFGGIVHAVATLIESDQIEKGSIATRIASLGVSVWTYFVWQALIGSGGAFAAVFGILTIGNAARGTGSTDIPITIYLAALCVVGGFVGYRLLTVLGIGLERKLSNLGRKTEKVNKKAELAERKAQKAIAEVSGVKQEARERANQDDRKILRLTEAQRIVDFLEKTRDAPLDGGLRGEALDVLSKLEDLRQRSPMERVLTIVSANLCFELGLRGGEMAALLDRAETHLVDFLNERKRDGVPESEDDETAWFNLACYHAVIAARTADRRAAHTTKALHALSRSFEIARDRGEGNLQKRLLKAHEDTDLKPLIHTVPFQTLLGTFGPVSNSKDT